MKYQDDQFDDLPQRPDWSDHGSNPWEQSHETPAQRGPVAGRKLVDFLAELQASQEQLTPTPVARGGSVQDVLARAAVAVPFADRAERRRRSIRRTVMACAAVCLAGAVGAAIWILPGMTTPPNQQSTLGTVVSAAETDFARFMATVRQVRMPEAPAATPRKLTESTKFPVALELPPATRSVASLPTSIVPLAGSNTEASPLTERSTASVARPAASPLSAGSSTPVDEPPTEVPH
jgi:hypothetical protein